MSNYRSTSYVPTKVLPKDLSTLSPADYATAVWALLESVDFDYERFCYIFEVNPNDDSVFEWYYAIHTGYVDAWKQLGTDEFDRRVGQWLI